MDTAFDDLDQHILRLLQQDSRRSLRELARLAKSTAPTVAARIRRMEATNVIQGYTVRLNPEAFASDLATVDVGPAQVQCHTCHSWTGKPLWETIASKRHPFCCPTCRRTFKQRHEELRKNL